ncbi:MAG TPA: hypothetical protein VMW08_11640 [Acidimicrobiales bacterium]|nr:hypothetical protein [Acidimicrobiales bacterium]
MAKQRPSKDKRQAQNRARREANAARAEVARARAEAEGPGSGDDKPPKQGFFSRMISPGRVDAPSSGSKESSARSSTTGKGRGERPAPIRGRPDGPIPRNDRGQVPGYRAALFAMVFAAAAVTLLLFIPIPIERTIDSPADAPAGCVVETTTTTTTSATDGEDEPVDDVQLTCRDSVTIPDELGFVAYLILLLPLLITGVGFWATTRDRQSRIWTFCLVALAVYLILFTIGGLLFVPSMIALTVASFQSRRAEQKLLVVQRIAGGGEVIETTADDIGDDEVDDDDIDDDDIDDDEVD